MRGIASGGPRDPYLLPDGPANVPALDPPGIFSNTSGRALVYPRDTGETTAVIITIGQSQTSNNISGAYHSSAHDNIHQVNVVDGGMYVAAEPMLGCGGNQGNFAVALADLLRADYGRVIIVPIAIGSSRAAQWAFGGILCDRIGATVARIRDTGWLNHPDTWILWGQGEGDNVDMTPAASYAASVRSVKAGFVAAGCTSHMLVALETRWAGTNSASVRQGQTDALSSELGIFAGPDLDAITDAKRVGGGHFNRAGASEQASLWREAIGSL